jgi:hypothetical protein
VIDLILEIDKFGSLTLPRLGEQKAGFILYQVEE